MIQEDFEQHVVKLQNALLGFAKSLTHNEDEAKDLLQETSLKALSNKAMYDVPEVLKVGYILLCVIFS